MGSEECGCCGLSVKRIECVGWVFGMKRVGMGREGKYYWDDCMIRHGASRTRRGLGLCTKYWRWLCICLLACLGLRTWVWDGVLWVRIATVIYERAKYYSKQ